MYTVVKTLNNTALSNPAGLAFLPKDGFYTSLSIQSAFQTRNIDASCEALAAPFSTEICRNCVESIFVHFLFK